MINLLKDHQSLVLLEVTNSCNDNVSLSAFNSLVFGLASNCSFIVYPMLANPVSIDCLETVHNRNNLLLSL